MLHWVERLHAAVDDDCCSEADRLADLVEPAVAQCMHVMERAGSADMVDSLYKMGVAVHTAGLLHATLPRLLWRRSIAAARRVIEIVTGEQRALSPVDRDIRTLLSRPDAEVARCLEDARGRASLQHEMPALADCSGVFEMGNKLEQDTSTLRFDLLHAVVFSGSMDELLAVCTRFLHGTAPDRGLAQWKCTNRFLFFCDARLTRIFALSYRDPWDLETLHRLALHNRDGRIAAKFAPLPSHETVGAGSDIPPLMVAIMIRDYSGIMRLISEKADVNAVFHGQTVLQVAQQFSPNSVCRELVAAGATHLVLPGAPTFTPSFKWIEALHAAVEADSCIGVLNMRPLIEQKIARHLCVMEKARSTSMVNVLYGLGVRVFVEADGYPSTLMAPLWVQNIAVLRRISEIAAEEKRVFSSTENEVLALVRKSDSEIRGYITFDNKHYASFKREMPILSRQCFHFHDTYGKTNVLQESDLLRAIAAGGSMDELLEFCTRFMHEIVSESTLVSICRRRAEKILFLCRNGHTRIFVMLQCWNRVAQTLHQIALENPDPEMAQTLGHAHPHIYQQTEADVPPLILAVMLNDQNNVQKILQAGADPDVTLFGHTALNYAHYFNKSPPIIGMLAGTNVSMQYASHRAKVELYKSAHPDVIKRVMNNIRGDADEKHKVLCEWAEIAESTGHSPPFLADVCSKRMRKAK